MKSRVKFATFVYFLNGFRIVKLEIIYFMIGLL